MLCVRVSQRKSLVSVRTKKEARASRRFSCSSFIHFFFFPVCWSLVSRFPPFHSFFLLLAFKQNEKYVHFLLLFAVDLSIYYFFSPLFIIYIFCGAIFSPKQKPLLPLLLEMLFSFFRIFLSFRFLYESKKGCSKLD